MNAHNVFSWMREAARLGIPLDLSTQTAGNPADFGTVGIKADVIAEKTAATGVTIDGVLLKDGQVTASAALFADNQGVTFGTGLDLSQYWNGTYLVSGSNMWGLSAPSPADPAYHSIAHEYFNDFRLVAADFDVTNDWAVTEDDAACTQAITEDVPGGELVLTNKATTDDNAQQIVFKQQSFTIAAGKKLWCEMRIKTVAATQIDWAAGLIDAEDMTGVADNMPANGMVFAKLDGATAFKFSSSDNGGNLETASLGVWDTSYHTLGFYFDGGATGAANCYVYVDGVLVAVLAAIVYATMAKVAPFFMVRNGDGTTTQTMTIDYVKVVQLR